MEDQRVAHHDGGVLAEVVAPEEILRRNKELATFAAGNDNKDIGASLGGPIAKDKLWFFAAVDPTRRTTFIGHAQTWWGNIDRKHDQSVMYPKGPVTPGGITDRLLSDYPNVYADLSAGSGLNALLRDEEHARAFLARHQDKLMFGSDCSDSVGSGSGCSGSQCIAAVKKLASSAGISEKIFRRNAVRILKIGSEASG